MKRSLLVLALLAAACGGGDKEASPQASATPSPPPSAAPTTPAPSPTKASRCLAVPLADMQRIAAGAEKDVGKMTFTEGAAVKSKDYSSVYMFAGKFSAPGVKSEVGVWASNKVKIGDGLLMSVDGFAKQFTVWPDADKTQAGIKQGDDGVSEAKDCLG